MKIKQVNFREAKSIEEQNELLRKFIPDCRDYAITDKINFLAVEIEENEYVIIKSRHKLDSDIEFIEVENAKEIELNLDKQLNNKELLFLIKK